MRSLVLRRTGVAAAAAALALLAAACGSSDGGDKGGDGKTAQADKTAQAGETAPAAPVKALTAAELEQAALTQADVKSGKLTKVPAKDEMAQEKVAADDAACSPLAMLQVGSYVGKPSAVVKRQWKGDPKKPAADATDEEKFLAGVDVPQVMVTLASYQDGGAEKVMKDLNTALTSCAGGYTFTAAGEKTKSLKVAKTDAPRAGDEAVALTSTLDADEGVKAPTKGVVVRKGATIAYFPAVNYAAAATGKDFAFPAEVVDAQLAKLK
ncbi:hypothetical protein ACF061_07970 [Streptomyces sp. NPDC015220]|uniref:hypothetical protein n=1 Tax=Streptomyces sp. NPDC015220 TaxID=3364947 RepID=UPI0036F6B7A8